MEPAKNTSCISSTWPNNTHLFTYQKCRGDKIPFQTVGSCSDKTAKARTAPLYLFSQSLGQRQQEIDRHISSGSAACTSVKKQMGFPLARLNWDNFGENNALHQLELALHLFVINVWKNSFCLCCSDSRRHESKGTRGLLTRAGGFLLLGFPMLCLLHAVWPHPLLSQAFQAELNFPHRPSQFS